MFMKLNYICMLMKADLNLHSGNKQMHNKTFKQDQTVVSLMSIKNDATSAY